jgi:uncharacterized membrane protein
MFDPTYNTIMAVSAGLGLVLLVAIGYQFDRGRSVYRPAWAVTFAALGAILAVTGLHMSLTWPLSGPTAFDNIAFGEPSLAMGVMLLAGAWLLGSRRFWPITTASLSSASEPREAAFGDPADEMTVESWPHLARLLQPLSCFAFIMGFALVAIGIVGIVYEPWEAPPMEPITGKFNGQQWLENGFLAIMYAATGLGAILLPFALLRRTFSEARGVLRVIGVCWLVTGAIWAAFGTLNYFTHIGLTINTYNASTSNGGNPAASGTHQQTRSALDNPKRSGQARTLCRLIESQALPRADYRAACAHRGRRV